MVERRRQLASPQPFTQPLGGKRLNMSIILLSIFPENVMAALVALIAGQSLGILMSLVFLRWKYRIAPVRP
jgi:hypothetical protein